MDLSLILMISGIIIILISFFVGRSKKQTDREIEELSLSFYQENDQLKRRIKVIEEELMLSTNKTPNKKKTSLNSASTINQIFISQVLTLHEQGYTLNEIAQRSTLSADQIATIIRTSQVAPH
ncbi:hypothetical protein [Kurthia sibirica]|uniref:Resolvase HTH domain-containing protein n=1 Tax=Kurthia sibirica TaxID=202750 RepID=A0A2U3AM03_9BACL|nr:hypothetical protein [Kurthia sibirica]PWI25549.1 hypothetical protein DEX24_08045 [Kurthia sibirica]GEK33926.1 hypothetical protein KSI01_14590 [Kurthia sibirica]